MNQKLREMTVGFLVDTLEELAKDKAGTLYDASEMERQARWTAIQGLLQARDMVVWGAKQAAMHQFKSTLPGSV